MRFTVDFLAIFANYRNFFICTIIIRVLLEILHGGGGINIRGFWQPCLHIGHKGMLY